MLRFNAEKRRTNVDMVKPFMKVFPVLFFTGCFFLLGLCLSEKTAFSIGYKSMGKRDPFVPLIGLGKSMTRQVSNSSIPISSVKFQGVTFDSKGERDAIINGEVMKSGDRIGNVVIEEIGADYVIVRIGNKTYRLALYE